MIDPMIQQPGMDAMGADVGTAETAGMGVVAGMPDAAPVDGIPMPPVGPVVDPAAPASVDPALAALDALMELPGPEAIRRVYTLAASASRAKTRIAASLDKLDARTYHDLLSRTPEARYVTELVGARRRLDALAQERRRLNLELTKGNVAPHRYQLLEVQIAACTAAMEQVAGGVLLFLTLPDPAILAAPAEPPAPAPSPELEQESTSTPPPLQPVV